jgi:hypothetical protein
MSDILEFLSNNGLISAIVSATSLGGIAWAWRCWRSRKDSELIYQFLRESQSEGGFTFRSTEAIAARTKLTEDRVASLCARHPKIRRSDKQKQMWTLVA